MRASRPEMNDTCGSDRAPFWKAYPAKYQRAVGRQSHVITPCQRSRCRGSSARTARSRLQQPALHDQLDDENAVQAHVDDSRGEPGLSHWIQLDLLRQPHPWRGCFSILSLLSLAVQIPGWRPRIGALGSVGRRPVDNPSTLALPTKPLHERLSQDRRAATDTSTRSIGFRALSIPVRQSDSGLSNQLAGNNRNVAARRPPQNVARFARSTCSTARLLSRN